MVSRGPSSVHAAGGAVDRRTFLRGLAVSSGAIAGSAAVPDTVFGTQPARGAVATGDVEWHRAPCPFCAVGCGLLVGIRDGRAVAVKGDTASPVSRGLACVRGYHALQALHGADRISSARIRSGGHLVDAPLTDALDLVAARLRETRAAHGSDSLAVYGSARWTVAERYVASRLFRGALGTHNVVSDAALDDASGAAGRLGSFGMHGAPGCYDDIEHADVFVLWNHNLAESDPVLFSRILERRRTAPAVRIIELTTRTTRTSYAADRSLPYAPRSELALANALCHEIVSRGWANRSFIERHVGFRVGRSAGSARAAGDTLAAESAESVDWEGYVRFLQAYEPDTMENVVGIPAAEVRWLASLYGDPARTIVSIWGADVNRHAQGTWLNNALYNIHLLVGKVATPGNAALCTTALADACTALECAGPLQPADRTAGAPTDLQRRLAARIWRTRAERVDARPAPDPLSLFVALEEGTVHFLWVQRADPLMRLPDLGRFRAAVSRTDRFLVVSDGYPTATTDTADVVLPAALWIEREGVTGNAERRLQHVAQLVPPPGDAADCAWQMIEVAQRLGLADAFPWPRAGQAQAAWHEYARFHAAASRRLPPLETLRAQPGALWPYTAQGGTNWRYSTAHDAAADARRGAFDFYGHVDHRAWIWLRPHQPPVEAPDAEFPFWLTSGPVLEHDVSGATRRVPVLHRAMPRAYAELNIRDAAQLGIRSGERVRLVGRRGSLEVEARIDHRTQPARGSVFVPSFDEAVPVNLLTLAASCPVSGQPDYGACVRIERIANGGTR